MNFDQPTIAYKVLTSAQAAMLLRDGSFAGSADDVRDGFIHLSSAAQLDATVDKYFAGVDGIVIAAVDVAAQGQTVRWEAARDGALFPHLYAPLRVADVVAHSTLTRAPDGAIVLPVPA